MNLIETKTLKSALDQLWLVVPKRGTLPVLENVRWCALDGRIDLVASDLDNAIEISVPSKGTKNGQYLDLLLPAETLCQALKSELSPTVLVGLQNGKFEVRAGGRVIVLPSKEPKDFPILPELGETTIACLLASSLKGALDRTLFCIATDPSRYSLHVLKLEIRGSLFRLVATDGHRLSLAEGAAKPGAKAELHTLVSRSTARLLTRILSTRVGGWVEFQTSSAESEGKFQMFRLADGTRLYGRAGQGQFPNYERVMPQAPLEATVVFDGAELVQGLDKLKAMARKNPNHPIAFEFSKNHPLLKATADGTEASVELPHTRVSGKARDIGFNHTYLSEYLKSVETERVSMALFPESICAAVLFDSFRYRHLLMPLRV